MTSVYCLLQVRDTKSVGQLKAVSAWFVLARVHQYAEYPAVSERD